MKQTFIPVLTVVVVMATVPHLLAQRVEPPSGWSVSHDGERQIYRPNGLTATESFTITIEARSPLGEGGLQQWFIHQVKADAESRGPFEETERLQQGPLGTLYLERAYRGNSKRVWDVVYIGWPLADHRGLFCLMASNLADSPTFHQYVRVGGRICGKTARSIEESTSVVK